MPSISFYVKQILQHVHTHVLSCTSRRIVSQFLLTFRDLHTNAPYTNTIYTHTLHRHAPYPTTLEKQCLVRTFKFYRFQPRLAIVNQTLAAAHQANISEMSVRHSIDYSKRQERRLWSV